MVCAKLKEVTHQQVRNDTSVRMEKCLDIVFKSSNFTKRFEWRREYVNLTG